MNSSFKVLILASFAIPASLKQDLNWDPTGDFPFYTKITYEEKFWCPASLIHLKWILASRVCAESVETDGSFSAETRDQSRKITSRYEDDSWWGANSPFLLGLDEAFEATRQTNCIQIARKSLKDFELVRVIGHDVLDDLKFDYFIKIENCNGNNDEKYKLRSLKSGSDCFVRQSTFVIQHFSFIFLSTGF